MNWFRNMMVGRYGTDEFNVFLISIALLLSLLSSGTNIYGFSVFSGILIVVYFFRAFSRDIWKRQRENSWFLKYFNPVRSWFQKMVYQTKDQIKNKYYKCPNCNQKLRVPRGKGKIEISCPKCRTEFIKRT